MSKIYIAKEVKAGYADKNSPNAAFPNDTYCYVNGSNSYQYRSFLQHDFSGIPCGSKIISAKLYIYPRSGNDNVNSGGHKFDTVISEWDESTLSWNNQPSIANTPIPAEWLVPTIGAWNSWDITDIAQRWVYQVLPNNGLQFVNKDETSYRTNWNFYNRKYNEGEYSTYVEVEYEPIEQWCISNERMVELADAIRAKTGEKEKLTIEGMIMAINNINPIMNFVESVEYAGCYYRIVDDVEEWLNPPMIPGVEYRTTERFNGKPLYAQTFDMGTMPNSETKIIEHGIVNMEYVPYRSATSPKGYAFPVHWPDNNVGNIQLYVNKTQICVYASTNWSATSCIVELKYTKTTD